ncbi:hypothetical protein [Geothrix sp. SG200]|uniref:hypothetical protein n=1 Tax=Geothrix sp. SG200 TaxID=2922865 RepID=UPI001FAC26D6|nr:hypothetical protein [Geothrix sp. SG200]
MRHDLYLLVAVLLVALALVVPRLALGEWKGAFLALLVLAAVVLGGIGLLVGAQWIGDGSGEGRGTWRSALAKGIGDLARFGLSGLAGAVIASGLAANHHLGARGEDWAAGLAGGLAGLTGVVLGRWMGGPRFWRLFGWFSLALLGAFVGGILGLLGPEPWGVDVGVLAPLAAFAALAASGRFRSRVSPQPPPPSA